MTPPEGVVLPAVRDARDGYVARTPPLPGKEQAERNEVGGALGGHRFRKDRDTCPERQHVSLWILKLDTRRSCRHTRTTVSRPTRTPEVLSPLSAPLAALVMLIVVILILPL